MSVPVLSTHFFHAHPHPPARFLRICMLVLVIGATLPGASPASAAPHSAAALGPPTQAVCPGSISFAELIQCSISAPGEKDDYSFPGSAGDNITIRLSRSSGSLWPTVHVLNPDGTALCGGVNALNHASVLINCTLPTSGSYTIRAEDYNGTETGEYYLYLQRLNGQVIASELAFGQTVSGEILTPAQNDTYSFSANAGDIVLLRLWVSSGDLWPFLHVYSPDGTGLCGGYNALTTGKSELVCTLTATGAHAVLVEDRDGISGGVYYLYVQRLNAPGNTQPIPFGQVLAGAIPVPARMDTYTFPAAAGDRLLLSMVEATSTYYGPELRLFDPAGQRICDTSRSFLDGCAITSAGTYTLLAGEYTGTDTGLYYLYLQRLNGPVNPVPVAFGLAEAGDLLAPAQNDTYIFTAEAGDKLLARLSQASGDFRAWIKVYAPDGTRLCSSNQDALAEIGSCTLPVTGSYALLAADYYQDGQGDYYLFVQRLNNPGNAVRIGFGQTHSGSILLPGELDTYAFSGQAGDSVLVRMTRASGELWPEFRLYGPDGTQLCSAWGYATAEVSSCGLPADGTYTILAEKYDERYNGEYLIYVQSLNQPGGPGSLYLPLVMK